MNIKTDLLTSLLNTTIPQTLTVGEMKGLCEIVEALVAEHDAQRDAELLNKIRVNINHLDKPNAITVLQMCIDIIKNDKEMNNG